MLLLSTRVHELAGFWKDRLEPKIRLDAEIRPVYLTDTNGIRSGTRIKGALRKLHTTIL